MTTHRALHRGDDKDRLCRFRKEGESGFSCIEDCVDTSIRNLEDDIKKSKIPLIMEAGNSNDNSRKKRNGEIQHLMYEIPLKKTWT